MKLNPLLLCFLGLASAPALACYTVYDKAGLIVYQGERAPVDLSEPLHVALQKAYPGGHLVFDQGASCSPVSIGQLWRSRAPHAPPNTIVSVKRGDRVELRQN